MRAGVRSYDRIITEAPGPQALRVGTPTVVLIAQIGVQLRPLRVW